MPPPPMPGNNPLMALLQQQGPPQGMPPGMPPQGLQGPPQGMPPQGMPQQGPPPGMLQQLMQGQQGPPQGMPPQGVQPGNLVESLARSGSMAPQPPINPVVDVYDQTPPIVQEAIRRRLFTQGM